ncbi:MAG TPA: transglycosylase SLT domain-containing protein [Solimonas sp.]|nr:transglycosylase SLT domain-containing protein [Solimonas sp.]
MPIVTHSLRTTATLALLLALGSAAQAGEDAQRTAFKAALQRAEAGQPALADESALAAYPLYPYLEAVRLRAQLDAGATGAVDVATPAFLARNPELPVARELRRSWLESLAARKDWGQFLANTPAPLDDPALRCSQLQAWIETGGYPGLREDLLTLWTTGAPMPQSCVAPFAWLRDQGQLTPERNEQRARLALDAGNADLAEWLLRSVPVARQAPLQRALRLLKEPERELRQIALHPEQPLAWPETLAALKTLARADPERAEAAWAQFGCANPETRRCARIGADSAWTVERELALAYAWNRDARALARFRALPDSALDDRAHEWRIRAALWQRDYDQAAAWLHELPDAMAADPRWIYGRARAQELSGRVRQAQPIYQTLAAGNGYYGLLSAWRLQQRYRARSQQAPYDPALQQRLWQLPAVQRAREAFLVGRLDWANAEWKLALQDQDAAARIQAARLASTWGWHLQAVATLGKPPLVEDFEITYPDPYRSQIAAAAAASGIPAEWLYGLIRQESLFVPTAVSASQALGLMQLLVPTARDTARKMKRPAPSREELFRPELNLSLGAAYLREMLERFDGQFVPALSAYNGGPNAVARWLPDEPVPADVWLENIPFNETRLYVPKILWHMAAAASRNGADGFDPAPLLQPVRRP